MSERADTAYSPRVREEEHSAAASPLPPLQREHRVDSRGDADRSDENRSDGHCPARDTHGEEDGTDREERCRVGDLPGHYRLRALGKRGESLHTRANRVYDGDERIDSNCEACRSNDARRNVLVSAKVPAANKRGRERERNNAKEKSRDKVAILDALKNRRALVAWLTWDDATMQGSLVSVPMRAEIPENIDVQPIVEFFSR